MKATSVLLIESARSTGVSFANALKRKYMVRIAHSGKQGLAMAETARPDVVVLDAASLRTSGSRIASRLRASLDELPIIHICNEDKSPDESAADVLLVMPFTARKLINRIERFAAADHGDKLEVGPFCLSRHHQTLTTPTTEKKLTPKLIALMELFMQNPNITLERRQIMQAIWNTDYMGDTRTLDVHIRWIRKVVEPNPRKPQYIQTVRGVGYRFSLLESGSNDGAAQKDSATAAQKDTAAAQKNVAAVETDAAKAASTENGKEGDSKVSDSKANGSKETGSKADSPKERSGKDA